MFGQLSNRESLRDLKVALDAHHSKFYIWGWARIFQCHHWLEPIKTDII
jgi:hypothetical protein